MRANAIIVGAGSSQRMGTDKVVRMLAGKPVIEYSLEIFQSHPAIEHICVVASESNMEKISQITKKFSKVRFIIPGGSCRSQSAWNGFESLRDYHSGVTCIHNAANPFISHQEIDSLLEALNDADAASVGHVVRDTLKRVDDAQGVIETIDRSNVMTMQTPQAFKTDVLSSLYGTVGVLDVTDELQLAEKSGKKIFIVPASDHNFKITTESDFHRAESLLRFSSRIGIGEDSHMYSDDGELVLGGITIPEHPRLEANSDGDVLLHAIFNAISGAIGGKSLGATADEMCKNGITDSKEYLHALMAHVREMGYKVEQLSCSLECLRPLIDPVSDNIKQAISGILNIAPSCIGITATSGERLTSFGKGEGIRATCIVHLAS